VIFSEWRKSVRSGSQGNCVEVAVSDCGGHVAVRDSKRPSGGILIFTPASWKAFVTGASKAEFSSR